MQWLIAQTQDLDFLSVNPPLARWVILASVLSSVKWRKPWYLISKIVDYVQAMLLEQ